MDSFYDLSPGAAEALGYVGGAFLACCMWPQLRKIFATRSAADTSYKMTALYVTGLTLTMLYLIHERAMAAWIPLAVETAGGQYIAGLKFLCERTSFGDRGRLQRGDSILRDGGSLAGVSSGPDLEPGAPSPPGGAAAAVAVSGAGGRQRAQRARAD